MIIFIQDRKAQYVIVNASTDETKDGTFLAGALTFVKGPVRATSRSQHLRRMLKNKRRSNAINIQPNSKLPESAMLLCHTRTPMTNTKRATSAIH